MVVVGRLPIRRCERDVANNGVFSPIPMAHTEQGYL